jgi:RNA polymerase-binding transcription factor DksA
MDIFDRAGRLEQAERDQVIRQHQSRPKEAPIIIEGEACCRDCEESIEDRLKAGIEASRCLECQQRKEHKEKGYA